MKKQSTGILEILSNTQKTIENQKSISNLQKSFLEKLIEHLPNMETRFACGGGAAN